MRKCKIEMTGSAQDFKAVVYTGKSTPLVKTTTVAKAAESLQVGKNELLVEVHACACNPTDYKHFLAGWGTAGCTVGSELAGTVLKVGEGDGGASARFSVGDSVASFVHGGYTHNADGGAFQEYVVVPQATTLNLGRKLHGVPAAPAPASAEGEQDVPAGSAFDTFEAATSLPLGLTTVGLSLHHHFQLGGTDSAKNNSQQWLLVWGGTTATGYLAVQIAKRVYGLKVVATANKAKYGKVLEGLGADAVVDYRDSDCVEQIRSVAAGAGGIAYAYDCVSSDETFNNCYACLREKAQGKAHLNNLLFKSPDAITSRGDKDVSFSGTLAYLAIGKDQDLNGLIVKTSEAMVKDHNEFWALAEKLVQEGKVVHLPLSLLPHGLESAEEGLSRLQEGRVSCHKLVFSVRNDKE